MRDPDIVIIQGCFTPPTRIVSKLATSTQNLKVKVKLEFRNDPIYTYKGRRLQTLLSAIQYPGGSASRAYLCFHICEIIQQFA